jgi:hypothetical protein
MRSARPLFLGLEGRPSVAWGEPRFAAQPQVLALTHEPGINAGPLRPAAEKGS